MNGDGEIALIYEVSGSEHIDEWEWCEGKSDPKKLFLLRKSWK